MLDPVPVQLSAHDVPFCHADGTVAHLDVRAVDPRVPSSVSRPVVNGLLRRDLGFEPGGKGPNGLPPIGPAWRDVAAKYKSQKGAQQQLTATAQLTASSMDDPRPQVGPDQRRGDAAVAQHPALGDDLLHQRALDFAEVSHSLELFGICADCRA